MERHEIINTVLIPSLQKLYEMDYFNIRNGVSERNICARLAHHMEIIMHGNSNYSGFFADVEYNRMNDSSRKHYDNSQKVSPDMVADLILHKRNAEHNLLAVEMKRWNNYDKRKDDRERLKSVVSSPRPEERKDCCVYETVLGAFIIYSPMKVKIEFYENVNGEGKQSGEIEFAYRPERNRFISLEIIREN